MKIGICLYSETGNTLFVAKKLKERLEKDGCGAEINVIEQENPSNTNPKKIKIKSMPELSLYDALIFASPVQAFTLAAVFNEYIKNIEPINGKSVLLYVTKNLRTKGFGGNKSISVMKDAVETKGGIVKNSGIIFWKKEDERNSQIEQLIEDFASCIKQLK